MTVSWIITEGALFDYSYSWTGGGNAAMFANSQSVRVTTSFFFGPTTYSTDQTTTGTLYTSTIRTSQTTAKTTTTAFVTDLPSVWVEYPEEALIYATRPSASWNNAASSIATFAASTTATVTRTTQVTTSILSTASASTFLEPVPYIPAGLGWGYSGFCPTVYAWSSAAGWQNEEVFETASQPVTNAELSFSGQVTVYPPTGNFQPPSAGGNSGFSFISATLQNQSLTWTRQTTTAATSTRASGGGAAAITRTTQTYTKSIHTTQSSSSAFLAVHTHRQATINGVTIPNTLTQSSWHASTQLVATTFADSKTTHGGSTTTTRLVSTVVTVDATPLIAGASAEVPSVSFMVRSPTLRGVLQFGKYQQFLTHNAGYATNTTQPGGAVLSHAAQSFVLPPQSFSTVMLQRGITAPAPNQTRSRTSSNSTTSWSLGFGKLTITTSSTNSATFGTTTSSYALAVDSDTLWTSSSNGLDLEGFTQSYYLAYLAAGGNPPTESFFAGGGAFTATQGTSEFTGSTVSAGSNVTAFAPLPHFEARTKDPFAILPPIATSAFYFTPGIQTIGFPLTA
jgi:hypothetical protein